MTKQSMTDKTQDAAGISEDAFSEDFKVDCIMAMRMALEADGAPARCPNRNCRRTGRCHVIPEGDAPLCHAGIPGRVAAEAALMLAFAYEFVDVLMAD